jgi:hypothetical protein
MLVQNRVPRRIFGSKGKKCRRMEILHNEGLHNLHYSPSALGMVKSRRVRLEEYESKEEIYKTLA